MSEATESVDVAPEDTNDENKRERKLEKIIDEDKMELKLKVLDGEESEYTVHAVADLPDHIQKKLLMHGLSQKLGDIAGGRDLGEIREGIDAQWANLLNGDFVTRVVGDGVNKRSKQNLAKKMETSLSDEEQELMQKMLEKMNIKLPSDQ